MIYKRCGRCGKRIPTGTTCPCYSQDKRTYKKAEGIKVQYHSGRWRKTRDYVMHMYNGIDLYALHRYGRIVPADTVHHIEPTKDRPNLFYEISNLIPVSDSSHKEIHHRYKTEDMGKVMDELRSCLDKYKNIMADGQGMICNDIVDGDAPGV